MVTQDITKREKTTPERSETSRRQPVYVPEVDVLEDSERITVMADVPGVKPENLDINLEENVLTISGDASSFETGGYSLAYGEFESGRFQRSFTISEKIDRESIEANTANGVVTITLPKREEEKARKIPVNAS